MRMVAGTLRRSIGAMAAQGDAGDVLPTTGGYFFARRSISTWSAEIFGTLNR